uniref:EGF-like domain-containing protein n=1 Tax=Macrostomum lignano TaxID=282301 RepID=A0A1I8GB96_9PLAT
LPPTTAHYAEFQSIEFQAVVTRNETHSYAIFNFGDFHSPVPRIFNLSSQKWDLKAFSGFTDIIFVQKQLPFSLRPDWPELPNLSPGSSGRPGRHVLQLSIGHGGAPECGSWIAAARANQSSSDFPGCSDCPFDFRTAVLDRRFSPYELECSGGSIRMCFRKSSYQCAQSFTGSSASGCKPENSWRCISYCRHLVSTRCCYRMSSAAAGSEISQLCRNSHAVGFVGDVMRRIITNDSLFFGFWSLQYQNELNGLRVCSSAGMISAYSAVRPMCTSQHYQPPAGNCSSMLCGQYAFCTVAPGSYNCTCIDGFQGNGTDNCTDVNECLSSSKCDANADCINLIGSFDCICKPGYYGNGTVCYPQMLLPTVNATNISDYDIVHASDGVPFLIGSHESSSFQVSNFGAISFSVYLRYLPYNSITAKINFPGAVVAPYLFVKPTPHYYRSDWTPKVCYELLNSSNHSSSSNWRAVKQIIEQEIRSEFNPLTALIVTWHILTPSLPWQSYRNRFDCVSKCYSNQTWNETNGYIDLCRGLCSRAEANASSSVFPGCSDCPTDFRTAVLDRRYSPYELECSGDSIRMCFSNTSYQCVQSFTGSSASGCKPENSWRCELENCRHLVSTRCCYRMSSTDAGSKISQLCRRSQSLGKVRAVLRWIMFDMPPTGHLISRSSDGAGHVRYFYRNSTNDSIQFGFGSPQYKNELYGLKVCSAAGMMAAYSTVRPMCTSENYQPPPPAFNRGDPHLSTLSNRTYTFNGHCEYHLLTSERWLDSPTLRLQARTAPVSGGGATAFVGVALKSGLNELAVSVMRNESSDDLDVFSSDGRRIGSVRGELAALSNATRLDSYRLEVPDNSTIDIVDESTGVSVTVTMETSSLRVGVQLDLEGKYPSGLDGLLGNSNASGFRLRNGSVLPANSSERQLFEFGNSWRLNSSEPSYLHYPAGKGRADFCDPSFEPAFAEDFKDNMLALFGGNAGLKNASEEVCRSSGSSYLTCMFDAAQLRSVAAAQDAAVAIRDETRTRVVLANRPPQFVSAPSQLRVNGSNSVGVTFSVTDPDGASPNVTVLEAVGGTAKLEAGTSSSWQLVWQPVDNWQGDIKLQLVAVDEVGAVTVWTPRIVVCDCGSRGSCCPDCGIADDTAYYHREECKCDLGFTGPQCEQAVKICLTSDCQEPQVVDK